MLFTVGFVIMTFLAPMDIIGDRTVTLPADTESYVIEIDMPGGGPISGTFSVNSGGSIVLMILDVDQYTAFKNGQSHESRFLVHGISGTFSIEQIDMEKCYIILQHDSTQETSKEVNVTYLIRSLDSTYSAYGIVTLIAGLPFIIYAMVGKGREIKSVHGSIEYLDVILFDDEKS